MKPRHNSGLLGTRARDYNVSTRLIRCDELEPPLPLVVVAGRFPVNMQNITVLYKFPLTNVTRCDMRAPFNAFFAGMEALHPLLGSHDSLAPKPGSHGGLASCYHSVFCRSEFRTSLRGMCLRRSNSDDSRKRQSLSRPHPNELNHALPQPRDRE